MARSLTVRHEETLAVSPLFLSFVLLACSWLALSAFAGAGGASDAVRPPDASTAALVP